QDAESAVVYVMEEMGISADAWPIYFTRVLTRLHGWTGFVRWRASAKHYYWAQQYPADIVDLLAIRLVMGLALLQESARSRGTPVRREQLNSVLRERGAESVLRYALHSGEVLPDWAQRIDDTLSRGNGTRCHDLLQRYWPLWHTQLGQEQAAALHELATAANATAALDALTPEDVAGLLQGLREFAQQEGMVWTLAMEAQSIDKLLTQVQAPQDSPSDKAPFAQAWFCIDVRAEPIRRHLERVGNYQTFGIAGFFGVPVGFLGYGKGSESHYCPAVITPKNLVLELPAALDPNNDDFLSTLGHALHDLKKSVLSPYVTVEAVGMLFGLDLFGKTLAPLAYSRWRSRIDTEKPVTRLLVDKLTREQADSIIRTLQRAMIVKALHEELKIERERVDDDMIRELREIALRHRDGPTRLRTEFRVSQTQEVEFIDKLREAYGVDADYANHQLERLGRIGYSLDEQVNYVHTALTMIGLTHTFSRFVLVVGHGGKTENNPYESALDCGACGGASGLVNARVFAQMANKAAVRERLAAMGITIPEDTWFMPALHVTTTDAIELFDLDLLPPRHLVYLDRLRNSLRAASRLTAAERMSKLSTEAKEIQPAQALRSAKRLAVDWAQVRPEWGLSGNVYGIVGRRSLTQAADLQGRPFLLSYDWRCDPKGRLLENLLAGPVVVGQWINLEYFFS
ncbi:MAG TPA: putative inorganic carbon transporter subunit DabA, partial [Rhodanobacteraceae bacterium]|nr:putative inorganic carbon transporter subunit DabA [Rhodanobacteraceae bacterium]